MTDWDPFYHMNTAYDSIIEWAGGESGASQAAVALIQSQEQEQAKDRTLIFIMAGIAAFLLLKK